MTAALPYGALSVHHFISQVGSYVGFAAIIAVAIMVLLLFAHARETADLRRRAEDAEDELAVLHEQVQWLHDAQSPGSGAADDAGAGAGRGAAAGPGAAGWGAAGGAAAGAAVPPPAAAGARGGRSAAAAPAGAGFATASRTGTGGVGATVAPVPAPASAAHARAAVLGAPVGVGAPALSSATKLIPATDEELHAVAAAARGGQAGAVSDRVEPPAGVAAAGRGPAPGVVAPPPSTAAAGANGRAPARAGTAAGGPRGGRPGQPGTVTSPRRNYGGAPERTGRRRPGGVLIAAVTLVVVAVAVVAVLVLSGSSSTHHPPTAASRTSSATKNQAAAARGKRKRATVKVNPSTVTVAVLNGTTTVNLAAGVSSKLGARGFHQGATGNATLQSQSTTVVGYAPGVPGARDDAYAVATALGLTPTAVKPVSSADQTVACGGATTNCPDQVVVTAGADLNSDAT